jgi:methylenetetrahydrofolate reductase (NADPH)
MTVRSMLGRGSPVFSFEYFPPKTEQGERALMRTVRAMKDLRPGFVSITCGAGGSTRARTLEWATQIKGEIGIEVVVHMTCLGRSRIELANEVVEAKRRGIENFLALRGDLPRDGAPVTTGPDACHFAIDLIRVVREAFPDACVLGACYPEGHVDAESRDLDLQRLKEKCDAGLDVLVTQLFFDNEHYFSFVERARAIGIGQPVIPGIMPVTDLAQVSRFTQMCGATLPPSLLQALGAHGDDREGVQSVGVAHAIEQCRELLDRGAPGVHFYTLNKSPATRLVVESLV